jgi:hypothetical protein
VLESARYSPMSCQDKVVFQGCDFVVFFGALCLGKHGDDNG